MSNAWTFQVYQSRGGPDKQEKGKKQALGGRLEVSWPGFDSIHTTTPPWRESNGSKWQEMA
jgi:hypothetical protein